MMQGEEGKDGDTGCILDSNCPCCGIPAPVLSASVESERNEIIGRVLLARMVRLRKRMGVRRTELSYDFELVSRQVKGHR